MTRLSGQPWNDCRNINVETLAELATTLRMLHDYDCGGGLTQLPPYRPHHWRTERMAAPPTWTQHMNTWNRAVAMVLAWDDATARSARPRLIHRDYRLGNTLWRDNRLVGVVDWITACYGDSNADVGHCRWNLCRAYGPEAADSFSKLYDLKHYDPLWDLLAVVGGVLDTPPQNSDEASRLDYFVEAAVSARLC
jgi:aminoglycoside phosphotransferase (APT) family kinase protein